MEATVCEAKNYEQTILSITTAGRITVQYPACDSHDQNLHTLDIQQSHHGSQMATLQNPVHCIEWTQFPAKCETLKLNSHTMNIASKVLLR